MADNSAATLSRHSLPKISFCGQRQRLLDAFCEAIQWTMLLDHHVAAVISGHDDLNGFDLLIHIAHEKHMTSKSADRVPMDLGNPDGYPGLRQ